jgi:hypothetical protein
MPHLRVLTPEALLIKSHMLSVLLKKTMLSNFAEDGTRLSFQTLTRDHVSFLASSFQDHPQYLSLSMHLSLMLHHLVFPPGLVSTRIVRTILLQSMNRGDVTLQFVCALESRAAVG